MPSLLRVWLVATNDFRALVRSTAFLVSLLLVPLLLVGSLVVQKVAADAAAVTARPVAVIDATGKLGEALVADGLARGDAEAMGARARYRVELLPESTDRLALAARVRRGELLAYVEVPPGLLDDPTAVVTVACERTDLELLAWVDGAVSARLRRLRLDALGVPADEQKRLDAHVKVERRDVHSNEGGVAVAGAKKTDSLLAVLVPFGLALLLFSSVMMVAPQLMTAVIEEKMSRVSEVLLGSATAFEIMLGKLFAGVMVSLVTGTLYLVALSRVGAALGLVPPNPVALVVAFYAFEVLTVMTMGALMLGVGAACSELKEAQTLVTPVVLLATTPLLTMTALLRDPHGSLAVGLSLVPPAAPIVLMFRVATPPGPPAWQLVVGGTTTFLAALGAVWVAGRVFRIGLLRAGQMPSLRELLRWVVRGE